MVKIKKLILEFGNERELSPTELNIGLPWLKTTISFLPIRGLDNKSFSVFAWLLSTLLVVLHILEESLCLFLSEFFRLSESWSSQPSLLLLEAVI